MVETDKLYQLNTSKDLDPLLERIGNSRLVLLGEASHGTHEYYTWRSAISRRLITEKGFRFLAVEGDWPDCYRINRYIKGLADQDKQPQELLGTFDRWPTWMWANWEITALVSWLRDYNATLSADRRIGFYGLDVYSLWESMAELVDYLEQNDPQAAASAREALSCFEPYSEDSHSLARAKTYHPELCKDEVIRLLKEVRTRAPFYDQDPEAALNAEQNALVAVNAEAYYRSMTGFDDNSWNVRDTHMVETLHRVLNFYGPESKAIIWEHNTHIGDARHTDMKRAGLVNVGQLVREYYGEEDVVLVGFGSYQGSVVAGYGWGQPMRELPVPEARSGSVEDLLHQESEQDRLLIFGADKGKGRFAGRMPHRAIGVVYNPNHEKHGNYVPTVLNSRYDAFIYLDETNALNPLHVQPDHFKMPDTYPFEV
jgi:erythromycin esterase